MLALNQVTIFLSSSFIVSERFLILESQINKFLLSANITGVSLLKLLKKSFIYVRSKSGPRMEPCGTPKVILRYTLLAFLPSDTNCCRCFR